MMSLWAQLIVPVLVSALLMACLPGRWLVRGLSAWLLSPAAIYVLLIVGELLTRPPVDDALGKALFGFGLIASVVAIPWLVLCALGFGIGLALRRRLRVRLGDPVPTAPPAATECGKPGPAAVHQERFGVDPSRKSGTRSLSAPALANPPLSGWREAHIGFANSGLSFDGLGVWTSAWRPVAGPPLRLPHPAYPEQIHDYYIHDIGPINQPLRFAAGELSNGVWGFYLPRNPAISCFDSDDGSLRIEQHFHDPFDARDEPARSWAVVMDAATQGVLVDCSAWESSRSICRADGSVLLHLQSNGFEALYRIKPVARSFTNVGEAGPEQPLSALAGVIEQARRLTDERERIPSYRRISGDGSLRVDLLSVEWSNSHWVNSPRVIETGGGRIVLDLWYSDWDALVSFAGARTVELALRRYRGGSRAVLWLDLARNLYRLRTQGADGDVDTSGSIEQAADALRAQCSASDGDVPRSWGVRSAPGRRIAPALTQRRSGVARELSAPGSPWRAALMMLAAALIAIAGVAFVTSTSPAPVPVKRALDRVPPMRPLRDSSGKVSAPLCTTLACPREKQGPDRNSTVPARP